MWLRKWKLEASEEGKLLVRSVNQSSGFYEVNSIDYSELDMLRLHQVKLPCKNFPAVLLHIDGWGFSCLPEEYNNEPNMIAQTVVGCTSANVEKGNPMKTTLHPMNTELLSEVAIEQAQCTLQKSSEQSRCQCKSLIKAHAKRMLSSLHYVHDNALSAKLVTTKATRHNEQLWLHVFTLHIVLLSNIHKWQQKWNSNPKQQRNASATAW